MKSKLKGLLTVMIVIGFAGVLLFSMKKGYFGVLDTSLEIADPYTRGGFEVVGDGYLVEYWGDETEVVLPPTIKTISSKAFQNNQDLVSVVIPSTVTKIEAGAFKGCKNLQTVQLDANIKELENKTFYNCRSLTTISLSNSITSIGYSAFQNCRSLTMVTLPNKLEFVGGRAFKNCSLETLTLPKTLVQAGKKGTDGPFSSSGAKTIVIEDGMKELTANLFIYSDIVEITIPSSVKKVDDLVFSGCKSLKKVDFKKGIETIGKYVFKDCTSLEKIILPKTLKKCSSTIIKNCENVTFRVRANSYAYRFVKKQKFKYKVKK